MSSSYFTRPFVERVEAILCDGYGVSTHTHAITAGIFRTLAEGRRIDDPGIDAESADRAVEWRWTETDRVRMPAPATTGRGLIRLEADLLVSYVYGPGTESSVYLPSIVVTGESAVDASRYVRDRAVTDAERIYLALRTQALWSDLVDPGVISVDRVLGALIIESTPAYDDPARLLVQAKYAVTLDRNNTQRVTP